DHPAAGERRHAGRAGPLMRTASSTLALAAALALGASGLAACEKKHEAEPAQVQADGQTVQTEGSSSAIDEAQVKAAAKDAAAQVAAGATAVAEGVKEGVKEGHSQAKQELREDEAASAPAPKS
ncbi:hypothetical protein, partial [Caulobacter sp. 17J65-9]|uniref:hypothetical protein n=1 Tax=Caulobacter sp. 17J65-9 TaxID=2709382 RepID=UPI0013CC1202